jgi:Holliday junction resolvase-like predicted endonuclease
MIFMSWNWEEFEQGPDQAGDLRVTLSRKGEIMLGARAMERLGEADWVVLMFDRMNSLIGVRPSNKHAKNAYPTVHKMKGRHRIVRANKFCRHYGIQFERTRAFVSAKVDEQGVLVLDLKETKAAGK